MPNISFTQFCNELARVLGTNQCLSAKATTKSILVSSVGVKSEEEGTVVKSRCKQDKKNSAQSSQIKDLHTKLDSAIAENSKFWKFLNLAAIQTAVTNTL